MIENPLPIARSKDILGGTLVFAGTRVPVHTLMDYLAAGDSIDEFLDDFPSVTREQLVQVLQVAEETLAANIHARLD